MKITRINEESGQIMLVVMAIFLMVSLTMVLGYSSSVFRSQRVVADLLDSRKSYYLAEAGVEDVAYRLSHGKSYTTAGETFSIDGHTVVIDTATVSGRKVVTAVGDWNDSQRKVEARLIAGDGVAFYYGVQIGQGGFVIGNNSGINGSVYSNGNIVGGNGSYITGTAVAVGEIDNVDIGTGTTSDAWANHLKDMNVTGAAFCQTSSNINKPCNTSKGIPSQVGYPLTAEEISGWKNDALAGGTHSGDKIISSNSSFGPKKITGKLIINDGYTLTVTGTLWVVGQITLGNNAGIVLSSGYGASGGIIITDNSVSMGNNVTLRGSGTSGSYLILISTYNSTAISIGNGNTTEVILYAQDGTITMGNNANVRSLTAKTINLGNNTVLNYTTGLLDAVFNSGPSGGWQFDSWKETN